MPLNDSKPVIRYIANNIGKLDNETTLDLGGHAIDLLKSRQLVFDEEDTTFKREVALVHGAR